MVSDSSAQRSPVELVAAFGSLHEAEFAARFLTDQGLPTDAMRLARPALESPALESAVPTPRRYGRRRLALPLVFAASGAVLLGLVGNILWNALFPDLLSGWRVVAIMFVGASAAGSIGLLVDNGLDPWARSGSARPSGTGRRRSAERAAVAVRGLERSQIDHAAKLLRWVGADGIHVRGDPR
jgi:hypothetical protein